MLSNRFYYNKVKERITPGIAELLLYSINPATRLCGVEYYYQHPLFFGNRKSLIDARVKEIFAEVPEVMATSADVIYMENAEKLVRETIEQQKH